ncbi:MAG TPA: hypothetical protein VEO19_01410 [Terriglobia bacterium]|nr:hypothetical protein [Terriglobia bacterium]
MQIPQQIVEWGKKQLTLKIIFEVVDDPQDSSQYREWLKPLNVWFFFNEGPLKSQLAPQAFKKVDHVTFAPNITKQTPRDVREFGWTTFKIGKEGAYLYVLAEPTREWGSLYGTRQYELQVFTGRSYSIAVSLPPLTATAGSPTTSVTPPSNKTTTPSPNKPESKLVL